MNWLQALILGIVEGVTEYLPISSTGHLILVAWLLGLSDDPAQWNAAFSFNVVIQVGAILAVLGLYRRRIVQMFRGVAGRDPAGLRLTANLTIAFLPAAIMGPLLVGPIREYLHGPWPVVGALFVGAWLMLAVAYSRRLQKPELCGRDLDDMNWQMALIIGFGQCIAMWPGTSRSMMTIVAAMMLGIRPRYAAEFSFLLGLITLGAATAYEAIEQGNAMVDQFGITNVLIGLAAAAISAAFAVKWFVGFLTRYGVAPFGWYRLIVATALAIALLAGWLTVPSALL